MSSNIQGFMICGITMAYTAYNALRRVNVGVTPSRRIRASNQQRHGTKRGEDSLRRSASFNCPSVAGKPLKFVG